MGGDCAATLRPWIPRLALIAQIRAAPTGPPSCLRPRDSARTGSPFLCPQHAGLVPAFPPPPLSPAPAPPGTALGALPPLAASSEVSSPSVLRVCSLYPPTPPSPPCVPRGQAGCLPPGLWPRAKCPAGKGGGVRAASRRTRPRDTGLWPSASPAARLRNGERIRGSSPPPRRRGRAARGRGERRRGGHLPGVERRGRRGRPEPGWVRRTVASWPLARDRPARPPTQGTRH